MVLLCYNLYVKLAAGDEVLIVRAVAADTGWSNLLTHLHSPQEVACSAFSVED